MSICLMNIVFLLVVPLHAFMESLAMVFVAKATSEMQREALMRESLVSTGSYHVRC